MAQTQTAEVTRLRPKGASPAIVPATNIGEAVHNLLKDGWTRLECPTLGRRYDTLIDSFLRMVSSPESEKYVIGAPRELDKDGEPDIGLIFKAKGQKKPHPRADEIAEGRTAYDSTKWTHHFKPRLLGYLDKTPGLLESHDTFFLESARMQSEAALLMLEIAEEMDRAMPGYDFAQRFLLGDSKHVTRLLHYLCDGPAEIAQRHRDQCFITGAIRSSRKGLWLVDNHGTIIRSAEETRPDSILIFFGRKAWEITRGRIQGIVHGVKDTSAHNPLTRKPRQSAIFFGHADVLPEEANWARDHMSDLTIPQHVEQWAKL